MSKMLAIRQISLHALAICIALLFVIPLVWVVSLSLQEPGHSLPQQIEWFPSKASWANYRHIFELLPLWRYLANSLLIAGLAVPLTILVASLAGFAMAQLPNNVRYTLLAFAIILRMVPSSALWLPRFVLFAKLGLIDSYAALLAPVWMGSSPFFVLLFYWSFRRMPAAMFDAARLDGLYGFGIWAWLAMPCAQAAIVAVSVLTFAQYWSDFINPLLYLKSEQSYTLAIGLRIFQQMDSMSWPLLMAAVVVMVLPMIILFVALQRVFWMRS